MCEEAYRSAIDGLVIQSKVGYSAVKEAQSPQVRPPTQHQLSHIDDGLSPCQISSGHEDAINPDLVPLRPMQPLCLRLWQTRWSLPMHVTCKVSAHHVRP